MIRKLEVWMHDLPNKSVVWKWRAALTTLFVALLAAVTLHAAPAYADNYDPPWNDRGDNDTDCNAGEICFKRDNGGPNSYLRHFWYTDHDHNDTAYSESRVFTSSGGYVMDNVTSWLNRDYSCDVTMWDVSGLGIWYDYMLLPDDDADSQYDYVGGSNNDRNNGHERCTDGSHG